MAQYIFQTEWTFNAPISEVWEEIYHSERWPAWWKAVESVTELEPGDEQGVGARRRYCWRGALPYRLRFEMKTTCVRKYLRLEGVATGELKGRGCWSFSTANSRTRVCYEWEVETTKSWIRLISPLARPLFVWNHNTVMRWGFEGLSRRLQNKITRSPCLP